MKTECEYTEIKVTDDHLLTDSSISLNELEHLINKRTNAILNDPLYFPKDKMKIHLISDLHCDFKKYTNKFPDCEVAIVAGDISENPKHLVEICQNNPETKIIFVPGNHDFYTASVESRMKDFYEVENNLHNLTVLQNSYVTINSVKFYGSTLWSGLDAYPGYPSPKLKDWYNYNISDSRYINSWNSSTMLEEHKIAKQKLTTFLNTKTPEKKVVITHFAPSLKSVHSSYTGAVPFNSYWCNNFSDDFISQADLWCHGHVHNNFDYTVNEYSPEKSCRVVCNPRGYITEYGEENENFDPELILEI
jgi:Icc-related predicted phosphoesterase